MLWVKGRHSFKFGFQYQHTYDHTNTNDTGSLLTTNFSNVQTAGFAARHATERHWQCLCQLFAGRSE